MASWYLSWVISCFPACSYVGINFQYNRGWVLERATRDYKAPSVRNIFLAGRIFFFFKPEWLMDKGPSSAFKGLKAIFGVKLQRLGCNFWSSFVEPQKNFSENFNIDLCSGPICWNKWDPFQLVMDFFEYLSTLIGSSESFFVVPACH